ncbi:TRAP transporter small permease subunit [Halomonas aquamarina]|uniref:TRAP transporter small permease subunit n=1 Tax=Vreelandella aquamarina TaxID=77097 RepID=UPI00235A3A48|nr:TRAP transporter small permease subunit [Halomonas aquamarina]MDC8442662.1 TRAP transporter small permease subunit [Halomonas aquamarina]
MERIDKINYTISLINKGIGKWLVSYFILFIAFILLYEIVARYVFSSSTVWASELSQMLFGAYVILSGGFLLADKGHIKVDIIYSRFSPRTRAAIDVITSFLFFMFAFVLLKEGWAFAVDSLIRMETSNSAWNPPVWPIKLLIPVGIILLLIQGIVKLVEDVLIFIQDQQAGKGDE